MSAYYWTDRDSKADTEFTLRYEHRAEFYWSAEALFTAVTVTSSADQSGVTDELDSDEDADYRELAERRLVAVDLVEGGGLCPIQPEVTAPWRPPVLCVIP